MKKEAEKRFARPVIDITPLSPTTTFTYAPEYRQILYNMGKDFSYSETIMRDTFARQNDELFTSVDDIARWKEDNGNFGKVYMLGGLLMYRYLQAEAKLRGGVLPHLKSNILERSERDLYGDQNYDHIGKMVEKGLINEAVELESDIFNARRESIFLDFCDTEPQLTEMIHMQCRILIPHIENAVFDGAMAVHRPFRINQEVESVRRAFRKKIT